MNHHHYHITSPTMTANNNNTSFNEDDDKNGKRLRIKSHEEATNKPKRKRITPQQFNILSDLFASTDTPNYQLRENTAEKLNMTNREVQVWFQNRRAKVNRNKLQEQRRQHDPFIYPICWTSPHHDDNQQDKFNTAAVVSTTENTEYSTTTTTTHEYDSSQSSVTSSSSNSSTPTLYPQLLPHMRPIDILALAAEYVQRCDEEKRLATEEKRWRPWI